MPDARLVPVLLLAAALAPAPARAQGSEDTFHRIAELERELGPLADLDAREARLAERRGLARMLRGLISSGSELRLLTAVSDALPKVATVRSLSMLDLQERPALKLALEGPDGLRSLAEQLETARDGCRLVTADVHGSKEGWNSTLECRFVGNAERPSGVRSREPGAVMPPADRLAQLASIVKAPEAAKARLGRIEREEAEVSKTLPTALELPAFESMLLALATRNQVLGKVTWQPPETKGPLQSAAFELRATGTFAGIHLLLERIGSLERLVALDEIAMSNARDAQLERVVDVVIKGIVLRATGDFGEYTYVDVPTPDTRDRLPWIVSPVGRRDPFASGPPQRSTADRVFTADTCADPATWKQGGLEGADLDQLSFLYSRVGFATPCAMVRDANGACHVVRIGDVLGAAKVQAIRRANMELIRTAEGAGGRLFPAYLQLARSFGAERPDAFCPLPTHRIPTAKHERVGTARAPGWEFAYLTVVDGALWGVTHAGNVAARIDSAGAVVAVYDTVSGRRTWGTDPSDPATRDPSFAGWGKPAEENGSGAPSEDQVWVRLEGTVELAEVGGLERRKRFAVPGSGRLLELGAFAWAHDEHGAWLVIDSVRGRVTPLRKPVKPKKGDSPALRQWAAFDGTHVWAPDPIGVARYLPDGTKVDVIAIGDRSLGFWRGPPVFAHGLAWFLLVEGSRGTISVPLAPATPAPKPRRGR